VYYIVLIPEFLSRVAIAEVFNGPRPEEEEPIQTSTSSVLPGPLDWLPPGVVPGKDSSSYQPKPNNEKSVNNNKNNQHHSKQQEIDDDYFHVPTSPTSGPLGGGHNRDGRVHNSIKPEVKQGGQRDHIQQHGGEQQQHGDGTKTVVAVVVGLLVVIVFVSVSMMLFVVRSRRRRIKSGMGGLGMVKDPMAEKRVTINMKVINQIKQ
jgi:hypothetical protein